MKISDFADVITGGTPSTSNKDFWENGNIPWLQSGSCKNSIVTKPDKYITNLGLKNTSAKLMPKGTVIIALTGATTGKVGILDFEACANQSVTGIIPNENFNPKYLFYQLINMRSKIVHDSYGGAQQHISQKYVKNIYVKLPEVSIQAKISNNLDEISNAIEYKKEILKYLTDLIDSIFDRLKSNKERSLNEIFDIIDGDRGKNYPKQNEIFDDGYCLFLNTGNVTKDGFMFLKNKYISKEKDEMLGTGKLKRNDIILTTRGTLGNVAYYNSNIPFNNVRINSGMVILRRKNSKFDYKYLEYSLKSNYFVKEIEHNLSGTAQPQIPIGKLKKLYIYEIEEEDQYKFASYVEMIESAKKIIQQDIKDLEALLETKMHEYFD